MIDPTWSEGIGAIARVSSIAATDTPILSRTWWVVVVVLYIVGVWAIVRLAKKKKGKT